MFLLHGDYATQNYGDLLIHWLMARRIFDTLSIKPVTPWLAESRNTDVAQPGDGWHDFWHASACIFGGGGYLQVLDHPRNKAKFMYRFSLPARALSFRRAPYAIIGPGVGPEVHGIGKREMRCLINNASVVAVRDDASKQVLVDAGVSSDAVRVTTDLAMALTRDDVPDHAWQRATELLADSTTHKRRFGVHLQSLIHKPETIADIARHIAQAFKASDDKDVSFVVFADHGTQSLKLIHEIFQAQNLPVTAMPSCDMWTLTAVIGSMDAVLTSKLHVGIVAWALGVPTCGFSTHGKTQRFYEQIHRAHFQTDADGSPGVVTEWFRNFMTEPDSFGQEPHELRSSIREVAEQNYVLVDRFIHGLGDVQTGR